MKKAVFLDKDGTLIKNVPYNVDLRRISFSAGGIEGLRIMQSAGYLLIVITNQPGVAMGYYGEGDVERVGRRLQEMAAAQGVSLAGLYYCPHHPDGTVREYRVRCDCRKPLPGLVLQAAREHNIELSRSWFVGDILHDVEAGKRAGCRTVLIDNGNETEWVIANERIPHYITTDMHQAARIICANSPD